MATCDYVQGFGDAWAGNGAPSSNEIPENGAIGVYNWYVDLVTNDLYQCLDATENAQVWVLRANG